jgi:hypothetical protein
VSIELDHVRALRPETSGPPAAAAARQRALLAYAIETEEVPARRRPRRGGRNAHARRRRVTPRLLVAALALVTVGGGSALAWVRLGPDPKDVATVQAHAKDDFPVHTPGWRPEFDAEHVVCDYRNVDVSPSTIYTFASEFPLAEQLTEARLFDECRTKTDAVRPSGIDAAPLLCVVTPPHEKLPIPIVTFGFADCAKAGLTVPPPGFLGERNRLRNEEIAIRAVPSDCPTAAQAVAWVRDQIKATGAQLVMSHVTEYAGGRCYLPFVSWGRGEVTIDATVNDPAPEKDGSTPGTVLPSITSVP